MLRVGDAPLRLLRAVRGIDLVELPQAEECCGFGGTFAVKNADTSMAMLGDEAPVHPRHAGRDLRLGRQLVPDADRRRLAPPAGRRGDDPPGRDPRLDRGGCSWAMRACRRPPAVPFQEAAKLALANTQLRRNMGKATQTIRAKRAAVVEEMPDWEALREAGRAIKERTLRHLDKYLLQLEESVTKAGGHVHWARDAAEAQRDRPRDRPRQGRQGGHQGQVAHDRRDRPQRRPRGRRDRRRPRPTWPS